MEQVGIDTIGITIPLDRLSDYNYGHRLEGGGFYRVHGRRVWAEACLPKRRLGENLTLLNAAEAVQEIQNLVQELGNHAPLQINHVDDLRVVRLDVTRNVRSNRDATELLLAFALHQRAPRRTTAVYAERGAFVYARTGARGAWAVAVYDKFSESSNPDAKGTLRIESRFRRESLAEAKWIERVDGTVRTLGDLNDARLGRLSKAAIERVGLDQPLRHPFQGSEAFQVDLEREEVVLGSVDS